jgi:hypothetical protein
MAADTIVFFPHHFATFNGGCDVFAMVPFRECHGGVKSEGKESQEEKSRASIVHIPSHTLGEYFTH